MARPARPPVDDLKSEAPRLIELVRSTVPPMHPAGLPFVAGGLGVAAAGRRHPWVRARDWPPRARAPLFFRHPPRVPPNRPGVVVAPADGRIALDRLRRSAGRTQHGRHPDAPDQHLPVGARRARAARSGRRRGASAVQYRAGQFLSADLRRGQRRQRAQQHVDPHNRRGRRRRRADRRTAGPPHRLRRQGRRQAHRSARPTA